MVDATARRKRDASLWEIDLDELSDLRQSEGHTSPIDEQRFRLREPCSPASRRYQSSARLILKCNYLTGKSFDSLRDGIILTWLGDAYEIFARLITAASKTNLEKLPSTRTYRSMNFRSFSLLL